MTTGIVENNRMKCSLYWPASEDSGGKMNSFVQIIEKFNSYIRYDN